VPREVRRHVSGRRVSRVRAGREKWRGRGGDVVLLLRIRAAQIARITAEHERRSEASREHPEQLAPEHRW